MSETTGVPPQASPKSSSLILTLGIIAILSGLLVVMAFELTKPRIALNKQRALEKAVFKVLPEAAARRNFQLDDTGLKALPEDAFAQANVIAGYDEQGQLTGLAMESKARGYQDIVKVLYGYSLENQCVIGLTILQSTETPGLGDRAGSDPAFLANFKHLDARLSPDGSALAHEIVTVKNGKKTDPWQIDGISGATVTSTAIGTALRESTDRMLPLLAKYGDALPRHLNN